MRNGSDRKLYKLVIYYKVYVAHKEIYYKDAPLPSVQVKTCDKKRGDEI